MTYTEAMLWLSTARSRVGEAGRRARSTIRELDAFLRRMEHMTEVYRVKINLHRSELEKPDQDLR
jgi:hypothetical protein